MVAVTIIAGAVAAASAIASSLIATGVIAWASVAASAIGAALAAGVGYLLRRRQAVGSASQAARSTIRQAISAARYVFGIGRVGGVLFFARTRDDDEKTIDFAIGISEGSIEGIWAVYVGGEYVRTQLASSTETPAGGRVVELEGVDQFAGQFRAYFHLDCATPQQCQANGAALRLAQPGHWTSAEHNLPISWAHIALTSDIQDTDREHEWRSAHEPIEFIVSGMRLTWPGQDTPIWTRNAAAIRYWWETQIRGRTVDEGSFAAAYAICNELLAGEGQPAVVLEPESLTLAPGASAVVRVTLDGAPEGTVAVRAQAASGYFEVAGSDALFDAGSFERPHEWTITAVDGLDDYRNAVGNVFFVSPHADAAQLPVTVAG